MPRRADGAPVQVAITGASGFIGRRLLIQLAAAGHRTRALLRRPPDDLDTAPTEIILGDLADADALARLVDGADVVIHLAGRIKARRRADYFAVNRDGTAALVRALAAAAGEPCLLLISSLAAREPQLSDYAASKRAAEIEAERFGGPVTVLRPPAVYGPGDRETLLFFRLAQGRRVPVPGPADARLALIHVDDLVRAILALIQTPHLAGCLTVSDARPQGHAWTEILECAAHAVGNASPRLLRVPGILLRSLAVAGDAWQWIGEANMLTSQKLRELRHADWAVHPDESRPIPGWRPQFDLAGGFADAVDWYRQAGWLSRR